MNSKEKIFSKAKKLHISGNINDAKKLYLKLIETDGDNFYLDPKIQLQNILNR